MKHFLILMALFFSTTSFAVPEDHAYSFVTRLLLENKVDGKLFFKHGHFVSPHGGPNFQIGYTKFGSESGAKGSIVLAPGRTESSLKYIELAYDLFKEGYSPIYAIDHRGQGFSDRMLENSHKGYVEKFEHYVDDFSKFVNQVVLVDPSVDKENLFLLTNSMGGGIAIRYLQETRENTPFKSGFHVGPMLQIEFTDGMTEGKARKLGWFLCLTGLTINGRSCNGYASPATDGNPGWTDYDPRERDIDPENPNPEDMTHSVARYKIRDFLWDRSYPQIVLGGPTVRWVWQATKTNQMMRRKKNLSKINIPMMIMTGELDNRSENPRHSWYCEQLNQLGKPCEYIEVPGAYHELLIEADKFRNPTVSKMLKFFNQF